MKDASVLAFEDWRRKFLEDKGREPNRHDTWEAAEVAALADARKPQTAETCQAVPPHPRGCLSSRRKEYTGNTPDGNYTGVEEICLVCGAVAKAREGEEIASLKAECDQLRRELDKQREMQGQVSCLDDVVKIQALRDEIDQAQAKCAEMQLLVDKQAEDAGLWFQAKTAAEAYLQQELRRLHAVIEKDNPGQALLERLGKAEQDVQYHKSAAEAASKIMHQIDEAWKADKARLEKLERVRELAQLLANGHMKFEEGEIWGPLHKALAACPKEN